MEDEKTESTELAIVEKAEPPLTHLVAITPGEMAEARGDAVTFFEQKLAIIEREIAEANAALNEARRNSWSTTALTTARNRLVDDETFYFKILEAVKAGHTIIPEFPIEIIAVRTGGKERYREQEYIGWIDRAETFLAAPVKTECLPAGEGEYRNPQPATASWRRTTDRKDDQGRALHNTVVSSTGSPVGPITFPSSTARSPLMRATAKAMESKVFDQIGVCLPVQNAAKGRVIKRQPRRRAVHAAVGDPLVIGQVVRKAQGGKQKVVSFIIGWYLNLNDL